MEDGEPGSLTLPDGLQILSFKVPDLGLSSVAYLGCLSLRRFRNVAVGFSDGSKG